MHSQWVSNLSHIQVLHSACTQWHISKCREVTLNLTKVESTLPTKVSNPSISWLDKRPQRNKKEQVRSACGSDMEWQTGSYVYLWGCTCNRINLTNNSGQTTLLFKSLFTIISFLQGMHLEITYKSSVVIANSKKVKKLIKEVTPGMNPNRPSCQIIDC